MTMIAAPSRSAGSIGEPTTTISSSPARSTGAVYTQFASSALIAGSHLDPNTFTSNASPSPTFNTATRPVVIKPPIPDVIPSPIRRVTRPSRRNTARGRSKNRNSTVTIVDTTAAVGMTSYQCIRSTFGAAGVLSTLGETLFEVGDGVHQGVDDLHKSAGLDPVTGSRRDRRDRGVDVAVDAIKVRLGLFAQVHSRLPRLHGRLTRYVAVGAVLVALWQLQRRAWVRRAAVILRPSGTTEVSA